MYIGNNVDESLRQLQLPSIKGVNQTKAPIAELTLVTIDKKASGIECHITG